MQTVCYKYKVYQQNRNHQKRLCEQLAIAARIYNHCIALHKRYYKLFGKYVSLYRMQAHIAKIKSNSYSQWKQINSQSIQQITQRIDEGYKRFFKKEAKYPPSFKSWKKYRSIAFKQTGYTLKGNTLTINKQKLRLKFHLSRPIGGKIQTVCLKRDPVGDWWITFTCRTIQEPIKAKPMMGKTAGFDFGLKHFLTLSDGKQMESPRFFFEELEQIRSKNRRLAKKLKGSANRKRARLELARLHRRIDNRRNDFHWKLAGLLVGKYDVMCFEDLNLKAMQSLWGRKISDLGFASFLNKLEYLAEKHGKTLVKVDRFYPSSKTCSHCGYIYKELSLKERRWICPECEKEHERDLNAAKNILKAGASACAGGNVRPVWAG